MTVASSWILLRGFPEFLADRGWDVHVLSSDGPELVEFGHHPHITTHAVAMSRRPHLFYDLVSLMRLIREVRSIRPVLANYGTPKAGLLVGLACTVLRVPHRLYKLRGLRLETVTGPSRVGLLLLERLLCLLSTSVLAVSESLRQKAIALHLVSAQRITVIGLGSSNGVDLERFRSSSTTGLDTSSLRRELGLRQDAPVVAFVGRLTADKGLVVLADAAGILRAEGVDFQLLVVGGIDDASGIRGRDRLRNSFPDVVVTGEMKDISRVLPACDVLCLPTFREGFPNIVLEAAACSVPSVTTDATGAVDSVVDRVTGLIVPRGNAAELVRALRELIASPALRLELGKQARSWVEKNFDRQEHWLRLEALYREAMR